MTSTRSLALLPLGVLLFASGCDPSSETVPATGGSGGATSTAGAGGSGGSTDTGTPKPTGVHFLVTERPQDANAQETDVADGTKVRWADPVRVVVYGQKPGDQLRVDVSKGQPNTTQAWGVFEVDAAGTIDLAASAPLSGTWSKADADAWLWSGPASDKPIFDLDVTVSTADHGLLRAEGMFHRQPLNLGISITKVNDGTKVGAISRPSGGSGKKAAFLTFGGSEGGAGSGEIMADYMAQLGYVAFGVGYFAEAGLPANLEQVPLEILKDDLDYLASQPDVDPARIGVIGASRGGELALLLGAMFPDRVHAVIADVPSGYVWGATTGKAVSAWSYGGMDVPFVPSSGAQLTPVVKNGKKYWAETPAFLADIAAASPDALAAARIPVEKTQGPIFLSGGKDDQLWPSCTLAQVAWDALAANKHTEKFADQITCHEDAGHFGTLLPGSSTQGSDGYYSAQYNLWFLVGGSAEGNAHAQRANNTAMRKFIDKVLGP